MRTERLGLALLAAVAMARGSDISIVRRYTPGTPAETAISAASTFTVVEAGVRRIDPNGFGSYRIASPPGGRITVEVLCAGQPVFSARTSAGKPVPCVLLSDPTPPPPAPPVPPAPSGSQPVPVTPSELVFRPCIVRTTAPAAEPSAVEIRMAATSEAVRIRDVKITVAMPDANGDGIPESAALFLAGRPGLRPTVFQRPDRPRTTFQTGSPFSPTIGVPTDAVLVYNNDPAVIGSWREKGFALQTMGGFREGKEYVQAHPDEVQRTAYGLPYAIGGDSFYMVPTAARNEAHAKWYLQAISAGSTAIAPEEPELFAATGYSNAFKQEWQAQYGSPWQPPHASIDARWRAENLKAALTVRQIRTILDAAQQQSPTTTRMLAVHSPVTYYDWRITVPHAALFALPGLQEVIAQVWTGTARTPARSAGVRAERTFELGYLEYSSLVYLLRGTGKRAWFLMDPVEDNPNLPMEDYHRNYEQTLLAALMFPEVDRYEVMPWPQRIYERVPQEYAAIVNTVVGALCEMWRYPAGKVAAGSDGLATFVADSMAYQRGEPYPSDFEGFYALSLPFVLRGVPIQILSLDRATEPGYLSRTRAAFLTYDLMKPRGPETNAAIAAWVRGGGALTVVGGADPYSAIADGWWRKAGLESPIDDLFAQCGIRTRRVPTPTVPEIDGGPFTPLLSSDGAEHNLANRRRYDLDLTPFARAGGSANVRFEDASPGDGWGAWVASAELRIGGKLAASFRAGSELETRFVEEDSRSGLAGEARYADGSAHWTYRFDRLPRDARVTLTVDMANGFRVTGRVAPPQGPPMVAADKAADPTLVRVRLPNRQAVTCYELPTGASPMYTVQGLPTPVAWTAPVGSGRVAWVGIAPSGLSTTAQTSRLTRHLAARAMGAAYKEAPAFVVRRGPYVGVRALGKEYALDGRYVDLLAPGLPLVEDPVVPARGLGFFIAARSARTAPAVLAAAGRVRAVCETSSSTGVLVAAPGGTMGAVRVASGRRTFIGARASTLLGEPVGVNATVESGSVLLRFANDPDGVVVRAGWR